MTTCAKLAWGPAQLIILSGTPTRFLGAPYAPIEVRSSGWCIEVKNEEDDLRRYLAYLCERLKPVQGLQLVRNLSRLKDVGGIKIVSLASWLSKISSAPAG